ncbi:MAG: hypothetical protein QW156_03830 [Candidatus Aenigmatarchaeota archaeon]
MKVSIDGINGAGKTYIVQLLQASLKYPIIKCPLNLNLLDCIKNNATSEKIIWEQENERCLYNQVYDSYENVIFDRAYLSHLIYSSLHYPNFESIHKYSYRLPDILIFIEIPYDLIVDSNKYALYCTKEEKIMIQNKMKQFLDSHERYERLRGFIWGSRKIHIYATNIEFIDEIIRLEKIIRKIN